MTDYVAVLEANYAELKWWISGNDYETLDWLSDTTKPTQAELDAQWPSVQTKLAKAITDKVAARQAVLDKLGLTADEVAALLS
jgi:hypothetical protein